MKTLEKDDVVVLSDSTIIREEVIGSGHIFYRIMKTNVVIENQPECVYGLEIESTLFGVKETATVNDVSTKFELVNQLFEMAVQNMVLPCTLKDVTYDFLVANY